jgi:hypothetical protein
MELKIEFYVVTGATLMDVTDQVYSKCLTLEKEKKDFLATISLDPETDEIFGVILVRSEYVDYLISEVRSDYVLYAFYDYSKYTYNKFL